MTPDALVLLNEDLQTNPTIRHYNLKAEFQADRLVVVGKVRSYYQKQVALHLVRKHAPHHVFILTTEIVVEPTS